MACKHLAPRPISISMEGPVKLLMGCPPPCSRTMTVVPSKRKRKLPAGIRPEFWAKLLETLEDDAAAREVREKMVEWFGRKFVDNRATKAVSNPY